MGDWSKVRIILYILNVSFNNVSIAMGTITIKYDILERWRVEVKIVGCVQMLPVCRDHDLYKTALKVK